MTPDELGDYCRQVEQHLTRVNGGHLVRIVGPAFDLVRGWANAGIPLTVVFRGIELKAERHRAGVSRRPLRIEFCDEDVREVHEAWTRAIGVTAAAGGAGDDSAAAADPDEAPAKRPSVPRHLSRAIDRLSRAAGRLDLPDAMRDVLGDALSQLTALRDRAASARGAAREEILARLASLDESFAAETRAAAPADVLGALASAAEAELAPYRARLSGDAWRRAVDATIDRLLRDRFGLPTIGTL